jgi:hypothetical protein
MVHSHKHAIVIEQIAIAFFLFTGNSLFSNGPVVSVVLWTTRIGALLAPSQGMFKIAVDGLITKFTSEFMLVMSAKMWPSDSSLVG